VAQAIIISALRAFRALAGNGFSLGPPTSDRFSSGGTYKDHAPMEQPLPKAWFKECDFEMIEAQQALQRSTCIATECK
jgi:hypothetical protein